MQQIDPEFPAPRRQKGNLRGTHFQIYLLRVADELLWWTVVFLEAKMDFPVHKACTSVQLLTPHLGPPPSTTDTRCTADAATREHRIKPVRRPTYALVSKQRERYH